MLLTRWDPFTNVWDETSRWTRPYAALPWSGPALSAAYPAVNVWQDENNVYAEAELPGLSPDDLQLYVTEGDRLVLQGERTPRRPEKGVWHRRERGFGTFRREVVLPVTVDADKVEARFENGVLFLILPKSEAARPRRIAVQAE